MEVSKKEIHKDTISMDNSATAINFKDNTKKDECVIEFKTEPVELLPKPLKIGIISPQRKMSETENNDSYSSASGSREDDAAKAENGQPSWPFKQASSSWTPFSGISRPSILHEPDGAGKPAMRGWPILRLDITKRQAIRSATLRSVKIKLPVSLTLPNKVLELIPDVDTDIRTVIDYYYTMAKFIATSLMSYVKASCKKGRIRNREDFHFLTRKFTTYILYKGLRKKRKARRLRLDYHLKRKIENCIKSYMVKFGDDYRPMSYDLDPMLP